MTFKQNFPETKFNMRLLTLFPGDSCYPISPKYKATKDQDVISVVDQLILIFKANPNLKS